MKNEGKPKKINQHHGEKGNNLCGMRQQLYLYHGNTVGTFNGEGAVKEYYPHARLTRYS